MRPSTTTTPGAPPDSGESRRPVARRLATVALLATVVICTGCARDDDPDAPVDGATLVPGASATVDLDGDGTLEHVAIGRDDASLTITDGALTYRSRERWRVERAVLGDVDGDGLIEVIALLDSVKGRHLGLFGFCFDRYREQLVTQAIYPAPIAVELVAGTDDMIVLLQRPDTGESEPRRLLLRWNGFSFTRIQEAATP